LGFAIPYLHNNEQHDYLPDFIVRLKASRDGAARHVILETKGFDPLEEVKTGAARRWVDAVNADRRHGVWDYKIARRPEEVRKVLDSFVT
jgi:type III restriction enzyme